MNTAARIVRRYLYGDAFIRLSPISVVLGHGGVISTDDLERVLQAHDIEAHDVVLHRDADDPGNEIRWEGRDAEGSLVMGRLALHLAHDSSRVVVSGEIVLASTITASPRSTFR